MIANIGNAYDYQDESINLRRISTVSGISTVSEVSNITDNSEDNQS